MRSFLIDRNTFKACHIGKMLNSRISRKHLSFHTPGHKRRGDDVTELSYTDNLASPSGCIRRAQEDIARILGASRAFLLTDGSTSGVYAMLKAARESGVKTIAAPVLSHKSFFNGCTLLGLTPVLFETPIGATPQSITDAAVKAALAEADALLITSPDYYGNIPDLQTIAALCRAEHKCLLIDGAHGGHLHFHPELYAGTYADFWVDGVHKSLPALTQGAVVCAKTDEGAELLFEAVEFFRTSSPSYPIMASVEYAVKYPQNVRLEAAATALREEYGAYPNRDWTKLIVFVKDGFAEAKRLEEKGIYAEFAEQNLVCFYLSPATTARQFRSLKKVLQDWKERGVLLREDQVQRIPAPVELQSIEGRETEWIAIENAVGRVSARTVGLFPPCLPLVRSGERFQREQVESLLRAQSTFGLKENNVLVVKE